MNIREGLPGPPMVVLTGEVRSRTFVLPVK